MYSVRLDEVDRFVVFFDVGEDMYDSDTMVINVGDFVYRDGDTFRHMTQREFESDWTPYDNEV